MKKTLLIIALAAACFAFAVPALAQEVNQTGGNEVNQTGNNSNAPQTVSLDNPLPTSDVPTLIGRIIKAALGIVGSIALVMFIYGGFTWMLSGGNSETIAKGQKILTWAAIGLVIIFTSYALVNFVITTIQAT